MYIIIIGCGRLGSALALELSASGHDVSVIERDGEKLKALGSGFNGHVIRGIEFDDGNLLEAGINRADFMLCVTPDDNINITASLVGRRIYHVPRIIARVGMPDKIYLYKELGIETINPTLLGVNLLKEKIKEE